ncbi:MAG: PDZ domain-containing protein [Verrucomicrobiota bacterium]
MKAKPMFISGFLGSAALFGITLAQPPEASLDRNPPQGKVEHQEKETKMHAFLGVATMPLPASLRAQLGVEEGVGILVHTLEPKSPAADHLKPHDILLAFNDQMLVNQEQLAVLVRRAGAGSEVQLRFLRKGEEETVSTILAEREAKRLDFRGRFPWPSQTMPGQAREMMKEWSPRTRSADEMRGQREESGRAGAGTSPSRPPVEQDVREERRSNTTASVKNMTWSEGDLWVNLVEANGKKELTVRRGEEELYRGDLNQDGEREKIPEEARDIVKRLESQGTKRAL